jgi:hypothetical protein
MNGDFSPNKTGALPFRAKKLELNGTKNSNSDSII